MIKYVSGILLGVVFSLSALGQSVEVKQVQVKTVTGYKTAKAGDTAIILDKDAQIKVSNAAIVLIETECKFASLMIFQNGEVSIVDQLSGKEFLVPSNGAKTVTGVVTVSDPGLKQVPVKIEFAGDVDPTPPGPDPGPVPPAPGPLPDAFDGLAAKVRQQSLTLAKRAEVAANYRSYAAQMMDPKNAVKTVGEFSALMVAERNKILGEAQPFWLSLLTFVNKDLTDRWPVDRKSLSEYWLAIAAGLESK